MPVNVVIESVAEDLASGTHPGYHGVYCSEVGAATQAAVHAGTR